VIPEEILRAANRTPELRGRVKPDATRIAIACEGRVVGFFTPHACSLGWRVGPLYVDPAFRKRGLARLAWVGYTDRVCVAFVADGNVASEALHRACGFTQWRRGPKGWFWRREPAQVAP
jgi:RimJ/RimL family protein N-acetyltransferase